jgi:hypothetical protein
MARYWCQDTSYHLIDHDINNAMVIWDLQSKLEKLPSASGLSMGYSGMHSKHRQIYRERIKT